MIAQDQRRPGKHCLRQDIPPPREIILVRRRRERHPEHLRRIPFEEQRRLGQKPRLVIGREHGKPAGGDRPVKGDQRVDGEAVEGGLVGPTREQPREAVVAEILDQ